MCGIVACFSPRQPVSPDALIRATSALDHRGPDGQRQWIAPHGHVGLGHARLSIIDLTTGDQPIANEDERLHIVVNGEFYDYERIQRELELGGHRLRTRSDSEILLHLYEEEGTQCLRHLRGEFAFVLWDEVNGLMFAARDRFGIKPLFWAQVGDTLYLASEAKALFAAGVPAAWDHEAVYQDLTVISDGDRSLFRGVHQVPPGHYLLAGRYRGPQLVRYWDHDFPRVDAPPSRYDETEHVERLRAALLEATRLRLRADVPVGCYLSGGLDSCTLLGMAMQLRSDPIEAFTIAFEEGPFDEGPVAEEMARHAGARFHPFRMPEDMLADHFADAVWQCETITFNAGPVAKYLLSEKVRDFGFKVVLTGEGSDEIFGGYPHFRRDLLLYGSDGGDPEIRRGRVAELLEANKDVGKFFMPTGEPMPALDGVRRMLGFAPSWMEQGAARQARLRDLLSPGFAAEFDGRDPYRVFLARLDVAGRTSGREPLYQSMYLWLKAFFPNKLLNFLGDRMEMAHSIEGRTPLMDHHLVELVHQMPIDMKVRGMTEKYALREAARPFITDTVYRRQKHPFSAPFNLKSKLNQLIHDTLRSRVLAAMPFFDAGAVHGLLERAARTQDPDVHDRQYALLMLVLSLCILHERYRL
ncbi:MAG: asparagine synthase (glutamine-hydrolyzing) [Candidatus Binatia bacterium]